MNASCSVPASAMGCSFEVTSGAHASHARGIGFAREMPMLRERGDEDVRPGAGGVDHQPGIGGPVRKRLRDTRGAQDCGGAAEREDRLAVAVLVLHELERLSV